MIEFFEEHAAVGQSRHGVRIGSPVTLECQHGGVRRDGVAHERDYKVEVTSDGVGWHPLVLHLSLNSSSQLTSRPLKPGYFAIARSLHGVLVPVPPKPVVPLGNLRTVAPSRSTVLLQGESGTGKELIAKAIHLNS